MRTLFLPLLLVPGLLSQERMPMACYVDMAKIASMVQQEEKCLATMIYGEARGEPEEGKVAVAYTAFNRALKKTVCGVVLAPKQYSIFNNNPALKAAALSVNVDPQQKNKIDQKGWYNSVQVAKAVMTGQVEDPTRGATHYLADKLMKIKGYKYPKWSKEYKMIVAIENHRFFKQEKKS